MIGIRHHVKQIIIIIKAMIENIYDIIVIGAGSGGLSVGLSMNKLGFKVLMIAKLTRKLVVNV
jgi:ribulose 1,5-bisphosphate synthetase/thiazole synthase